MENMNNKLIIFALIFIIGCKKETTTQPKTQTPQSITAYVIIQGAMFYEINGIKDTAYGNNIRQKIIMNKGQTIKASAYQPYYTTTITNGVATPQTAYNKVYMSITVDNDSVSSRTCSCINQITYTLK